MTPTKSFVSRYAWRTVLATLNVLFLAACGDYEKGEGENSYLHADFGEVYTEADRSVKTLETDDGQRLTLAQSYTAQWLAKPDTLYRALLYYNLKTNEAPDLLRCIQVPTVSPHPSSFFHDSILTQPVGFESAWVSRNRRYLNLGLLIKTGSPEEGQELEKQVFSIVRDTLRVNPDSSRTLCLRLFHDQANQPEYYTQNFFLSVRTSPAQADSVSITINTYRGEVCKSLPL